MKPALKSQPFRPSSVDEGSGQNQSTVGMVTYDANDVAIACKCSVRHVWRMRDGGLMPPPIHVGKLIRWPATTIHDWIAKGCPPHRKGGR